MRLHALLPLLILPGSLALADGCHVLTRSSSASVPTVESESCYEFVGMSDSAIDWACSNETREMLNSQRHLVEHCANDSQGQCIAALTQESLANPKSATDNRELPRPGVPNDAKVVTYFYRVEDLGQARTDCENKGGLWREQ